MILRLSAFRLMVCSSRQYFDDDAVKFLMRSDAREFAFESFNYLSHLNYELPSASISALVSDGRHMAQSV